MSRRVLLSRYRHLQSKDERAVALLRDDVHPLEVAVIVNVSLEYILNLTRMIEKRDAHRKCGS